MPQEQAPVRRIQVNEKAVLGLGSGGTVVFEGLLGGRAVAVKRMLLQHNVIAEQEVRYLQRVDLHPNLVTYYDHEADKDFVYLALERCEGNLENLVELMKAAEEGSDQWRAMPLSAVFTEGPAELRSPAAMVGLMQQSLKGLNFLH